jgi:PAS domain S-box-containing protein
VTSATGVVLNVNDDEVGRYASSRILQRAGYRVIEAGSGAAALEILQRERPDLVLLDVKLPDMSGLEVCRHIKTTPDTASTLVVHMSASYVHSRDAVRGLESGADGYLTEPVDPTVLVATVNSFMRLRRAEAALRESEARYRLLFERNPLPTWVFDAESLTVLAVNDAALEHYGYTREEFMALSVADLRPLEEVPALRRVLAKGEASFRRETRHRKRDGTVIDVEVMAAPLQFGDHRARLVIASDVTDQRRVEQARGELLVREQAARAEAEAANQSKDEFLAVLSHELRTPLHAIYGWARMLRSMPLDAATTERALTAIERNSALQAQIIEDLLDVSRVITGKLVLDRRPVELSDVVQAALEGVRGQAAARGVQLDLQIGDRGIVVSGDPARLQQIVANLLSNGVKFTPGGGRVTVCLGRHEEGVRLVVSDTGLGIRPDFLPHVFQRFRQADSSTTRAYTGLGLGLAIVRHLVELHQGSVDVASEGVGRGTTFTVTLPREIVLPPGTTTEPPSQAPEPAVPLAGVHVLLVDDDRDSLALAAAALEQSGARVTRAESSGDALAAMDRGVPDVVVSDIGMPGGDGYALLRRIRARPLDAGGSVPAVALTAYAMESDTERSRDAGYQVHLSKPVDPLALTRVVRRLAPRRAS